MLVLASDSRLSPRFRVAAEDSVPVPDPVPAAGRDSGPRSALIRRSAPLALEVSIWDLDCVWPGMRSWVMRMDAERSELARFGLLWVSRVLDFGRPTRRPTAPAVGRRRVLCLFCLSHPPTLGGSRLSESDVLCSVAWRVFPGRRVAMSCGPRDPVASDEL